jgi:hypothetical protein
MAFEFELTLIQIVCLLNVHDSHRNDLDIVGLSAISISDIHLINDLFQHFNAYSTYYNHILVNGMTLSVR